MLVSNVEIEGACGSGDETGDGVNRSDRPPPHKYPYIYETSIQTDVKMYEIKSDAPVPAGDHKLGFQFDYDGNGVGKGAYAWRTVFCVACFGSVLFWFGRAWRRRGHLASFLTTHPTTPQTCRRHRHALRGRAAGRAGPHRGDAVLQNLVGRDLWSVVRLCGCTYMYVFEYLSIYICIYGEARGSVYGWILSVSLSL